VPTVQPKQATVGDITAQALYFSGVWAASYETHRAAEP
jgi:hypothetical protein